MVNAKKRQAVRRRRKTMSVRRKVRATGRPRLSVFRSLKNIYCQIIDDEQGRTIAAASSLDKDLRVGIAGRSKKHDCAVRLGAFEAA